MRKPINLLVALLLTTPALAQNESPDKVVVTGSVESNMLVPQEDDAIGTGEYDDWLWSNTYFDVNVNSKYVDGGLRGEYMDKPMPGYEKTSKVQDSPTSG